MHDVRFHPNDPNKAIAGRSYGKIVYSSDGGNTWTLVTLVAGLTSFARVEVAYAGSQPNIVFASLDRNSGEIWKSADGGATWTYVSRPQHLGSQGWYDNTIWVDPTNDSHLVIGGLDLWRSTDAGATWTRISFTPSASLAYNTTYTATITTGVKDPAGNSMAAPKNWSFTTAGPPRHTLSATIAGSGAGSVSSTPPGLSCTAGTCPAEFDAGSQVTISANPGVDSVFAGWSGACGGTGNCSVTMDSDKSVTATFNTAPIVKIGGASYANLQGAYNGAFAGDVIQARAVDFTENLTFNRNVAVTLKGGYDSNYTANSGYTVLHGILAVSDGTVAVENLTIR